MTVYFCNQGELDLAAVETMGVSVKVGNSPIGFFGTGLKYAIATLLRLGCRVTIRTGGFTYYLTSSPRLIRGEEFQVVCMDGRPLGFTTQLGRNWQAWQAYRELACNARDEGEHSIFSENDGYDYSVSNWGTVVAVTGDAIEQAHARRAEYFCEGRRVLSHVPGVGECLEGAGRTVFYRGVAVLELNEPGAFTWNILQTIELTEDRTLKYPWSLAYVVGRVVAASRNYEVVSSVIMAPEKTVEANANFGGVLESEISEEFKIAARTHAAKPGMNKSARSLWEGIAPTEEIYRKVELDWGDLEMLEQAHRLCERMDCAYARGEPQFVANLGEGTLGMVRNGRVLISHNCFSMGLETLAGTLYEEHLHLNDGLEDCSRELQNRLLNKLVSTARRLLEVDPSGAPLTSRDSVSNVIKATVDDEMPF